MELQQLHIWKHTYGEEPLRVGPPVTAPALFERHEQFATQNAPITSVTTVSSCCIVVIP